MKAILRKIRISSKKVNLVAALVRNKKVLDAVDVLKFTPKRSAPVLRKLIESATANAKTNLKQNPEDLMIKEIIVTEGPTYKRSIPISKGRMHPILKRTSHITVKLGQQSEEKPKEIKESTK
jgi:large subunit ribosomal protein L22